MIFFALSSICYVFSLGFFMLNAFMVSFIFMLGGMIFSLINHLKNPVYPFYPEKISEEKMKEIKKMIEEME